MIPSALSGQLQQGLADFLRFSFWSSTPGMEHVVNDLLAEPGGLLKGPYVSLKLPFVSGKNPNFFPNVPMGFTPHFHQEQAFARLSGRRKLSTLVATGTGSGKTESFLLPILDHCLSDAAHKGVKAILVYPMNALATDQALRIARMIHGNDRLRGKVRAGLYIGEDKGKKASGEKVMGPATVITDRPTMQDAPPDILLTNYKMLDYLLLRPGDQGIWKNNARGTLRFLVVDEIHTFDGAQGTDLACLIRRIKRRLQVDDGSLCCVGTSATLGGPSAADELRGYAKKVFGEDFDADAVVGERRMSEDEFLAGASIDWTEEPDLSALARLDPTQVTEPSDWLRDQVALWFGACHDDADPDSWAVTLGDRLKHHAVFAALLEALGGRAIALDELVEELGRSRAVWRDHPAFGRFVLESLLALVSTARSWRRELPDVAAARQEAGRPRPVQPFLDVRLQLWQRELRRMVASVGVRPRVRHSMDLDRDTRRQHLPMIHCRECGAMGWAALVQRDKPHLRRTELDSFYRAFFSRDSQVEFLFPAAAVPESDPGWPRPPFLLDTEELTVRGPEEEHDGPALLVVPASSVKSTSRGPELSRDCPFCMARDSLSILGFRAATLTSVTIDQLFASRFNDDKKLLTFSDSVQDAAHRAGFFGARTWRTNLRLAMLQLIRRWEEERPTEPLSLAALADNLSDSWKDQLDEATWVSTFLAPNMYWLHDWGLLKSSGEVPDDSNLDRLIAWRLAYEACTEFGMQAEIGRSLPRTGAATVLPDPARLEAAVEALLEPLRNEVPGLRDVDLATVRHFVAGLLYHLRTRGGILARSLPNEYVESGGRDHHAFKRTNALPVYGRTSRLPEFLADRARTARFETWVGRTETSWYARWVARCFGAKKALTADAASTYPVVLARLVKAGLLAECIGQKNEQFWGLDEGGLLVSAQVTGMACNRCGHRTHVGSSEVESWTGLPCLTLCCSGRYEVDAAPPQDYFGRLYASGDLARIFTEEHTGLLSREDRERVEQEFKARAGDPADPDSRKPWYANLLSCTPTLEMGIDIGDLSTVVLCSVPPAQANYLQRVGRAGREDGNALVLTVASGRPHDLYFYAEPKEMMEGDVSPPGIFLDAPAVLERQLTAFCFDRWIAKVGDAADLPPLLRMVLSHLDDTDSSRFPFSLLAFVEQSQPTILREFGEMFEGAISGETKDHLHRFMVGTDEGKAGLRWNILEALTRERKQRESLSVKARALRDEIKRLQASEAKAADHDEQIEKLEAEKAALQALVRAINARHTLEFLTGEGLLPNYAFPESAVSLKSVIWRKKKAATAKGSNYETWTYEYKRSPASALSELAPNADFYAGGRRVAIDQVDVAVSEVEDWRFCDECNHAQPIGSGDETTACPACSSATWKDDGQKHRLLKLQQVFANAPDRESRIRDDKDEREPRFFQRQILVDVHDEDRGGAWRVDDDRMPFGFEFLRKATFREVNFGEPTAQGASTVIAGREAVRPGFEICARCGKVQKPRKDPEHALSCPSRREGAKQQMEDCLYLYREFSSEALRMLLPMADLGSTRQLNSFVAALQVGLKMRFGGSVDHLKTTVYSDPVEGSALRRQYLVIFDTVPGGTGYLKQLVTPATEGGEMPLFEAMEFARQRVEDCPCWADPDRDGCYRCLYAYRIARDMEETSAQVASDLLRRLLAGRHKLVPIASLGDISISGLLDSVLEARFLEAFRLISRDGRNGKLKPAIVNQKPGYRWTLGKAEWEIEPQVHPPIPESAGVPVSIDFVLRPASASSDRRIAVFLDGWAFHKSNLGKDLRQRMALIASGNWDVWSFTWSDLDAKFAVAAPKPVQEFAVPDAVKVRGMLQKGGLAAYANIADGSTFDWLEAELLGDGLPWQKIAHGVLAGRMDPALMADAADWAAFVNGVAPPAARAGLASMQPKLLTRDRGGINPYFELMAVHDGTSPAVVCTLDDRVEHVEDPEYKLAWQGYLRLFQLLRHVSNSWFMTRLGTEEGGLYASIAAARGAGPTEAGWAGAGDIEPAYQALAGRLMAAGVREPEIGGETPDARNDTWGEAELLWEEERVAVTSRVVADAARHVVAPGWTVLFIEDLNGDADAVIEALGRTEET